MTLPDQGGEQTDVARTFNIGGSTMTTANVTFGVNQKRA